MNRISEVKIARLAEFSGRIVVGFLETRNSPFVGILVLVEERLDLLLLLVLGEFCRISELEKRGRKLDKPLGVNGAHLTHILLGGEHELVIDKPLRLSLVYGTGGVNINDLTVD